MKTRILVIEDDASISELICMNLEAAGYEPVSYTHLSTAVCYGSIGSGRLGLGDNRETGRMSIKARGTDIANNMRRQYNSIAVQPYPAPVRNRGDTE